MTLPDPFAPPAGDPARRPAPAAPHEGRPPVPERGDVWRGPAGPWTPLPAPPTGLATAAVVLAGVWTLLQVLSLATSFAAAEVYGAAAAAGVNLLDVVTTYDAVVAYFVPVQVAAFVVGCLWLQRSRAVATTLSSSVRQVRGPAWVWFGWFVPVVLLWFPYQVVRDVRTAAQGTQARGTGLWWACWLVLLVSTNQSAMTALGWSVSRDPGQLPLFEAVATVATVAAAVLWARIVLGVTRSLTARTTPAD
jgi:hypothetical protein